MRLYIFDEDHAEHKFWFNFRKSNKSSEWPEDVLKRKYNAKLVIEKDPKINSGVYIEFEDEAMATFFLLRYQ